LYGKQETAAAHELAPRTIHSGSLSVTGKRQQQDPLEYLAKVLTGAGELSALHLL